MPRPHAWLFVLLAMAAFAANSLLCRQALAATRMDPASFTAIRIAAGAACLAVLVRVRDGAGRLSGTWSSALALFAYAACFSFAYVSLPAGTGALLLFGAVQVTMVSAAWRSGERLRAPQSVGLLLAFCGLVGLVLPGISAPPWRGAVLMLAAGVAWGIYSLRGRGGGDATRVTAGNFVRAVPFAAVLGLASLPSASIDLAGCGLAVASGALASGLGYALWYAALPEITRAGAAAVQLSVPVLAAVGGVVLLGEELTPRLVFAGGAILGGIAAVLSSPPRR